MSKKASVQVPSSAAATCAQCLKSTELCVCDKIVNLENQVHVLILQHPQEPDKELGTARIAHLSLEKSTLKVGLSWRNLAHALGKTVRAERWGVLYLGSGAKGELPKTNGGLTFLSRKGERETAPDTLEGIVILDGSWSQAKALWWRNPWLLKLKRAILIPARPSLYKKLRKEPRKECLSTIESIGEALTALGEPPEIESQLKAIFSELLEKKRAVLKPSAAKIL